jgi:hypothetical protein
MSSVTAAPLSQSIQPAPTTRLSRESATVPLIPTTKAEHLNVWIVEAAPVGGQAQYITTVDRSYLPLPFGDTSLGTLYQLVFTVTGPEPTATTRYEASFQNPPVSFISADAPALMLPPFSTPKDPQIQATLYWANVDPQFARCFDYRLRLLVREIDNVTEQVVSTTSVILDPTVENQPPTP